MRFISQYPNFKLQIRPQRQKALGDGGVEVTQEALYAQFLPVSDGAMIFENEMAQAIKHFTFHGNTQHEDEATPTDPIARLSVFDSNEMAQVHGWSADVHAEVDAKLREHAYAANQDLIEATGSPIEAPFPSYDTFDGAPGVLITKLVEDGYDLENVLYYEQVFGPKRPEIIDVLERAVEIQKEAFVVA